MTEELKIAKSLHNFKLKLEQEEAYQIKNEKKIQIKNDKGETQYVRNDVVGLMGLLGKFDSRIHTMQDYKYLIKLKDKLKLCFLTNMNLLDLSLNEAKFLKEYLSNLSEKEGKENILAEFEIRSLIGLLEQF